MTEETVGRQTGLVHRIRHQITNPATERLIGGRPKELLTIDGDLFGFKIKTVHFEQGSFSSDQTMVLAIGEILDHDKRFHWRGGLVAHGALAFSTQEYHPKNEFSFCLGVLQTWVGGPRDAWLDGAEKKELFQNLVAYEERFRSSLFKRLTGIEPPKEEKKGSTLSALAERGAQLFPLLSTRRP